ncbi:MAG: DUF4149 domain-containing protein [Candidatus Rokubacteria bacterium]|nr:DUF4149 domain-containing protein [Candidatus Rokubacteria bacterium]
MSTLRLVGIACLAAWLGIAAFFSFGAAPLLFRVLDRGAAGAAVAALLPRYYVTGVVLAAIALVAFLVRAVAARGRWPESLTALLAGVIVAALGWQLFVTLPDAELARQMRDDRAFAAAHWRAIRENAAAMLAAAAALALQAVSGSGRRRG